MPTVEEYLNEDRVNQNAIGFKPEKIFALNESSKDICIVVLKSVHEDLVKST